MDVTPYIETIRELPKLGYLDMGMDSDFARIRAAFPDARLAVMYTPSRLAEGDETFFRSDVERIRRERAPCDVVLADLPFDTPDDRVNGVHSELARQLGLTKSSASRLLSTLETVGYVDNFGGQYSLKPECRPLVRARLLGRFLQAASPLMEELTREFHETVSLVAALFENHAEVVWTAESPRAGREYN